MDSTDPAQVRMDHLAADRAEDVANEQRNAEQTAAINAEVRREDAQATLDSLTYRLVVWLRQQPELRTKMDGTPIDDLGSGIYGFTINDGSVTADVSMTLQLTADQQF